MSRLTKKYNKYGKPYCFNCKESVVFDNVIVKQALYKLGKLEDLEEQLGCPLDVLFRALKDGIYHDEKFEHPVLILNEDSFKKNNFSLLVVGTIVYLKEYKKTWWLKEDKSE